MIRLGETLRGRGPSASRWANAVSRWQTHEAPDSLALCQVRQVLLLELVRAKGVCCGEKGC